GAAGQRRDQVSLPRHLIALAPKTKPSARWSALPEINRRRRRRRREPRDRIGADIVKAMLGLKDLRHRIERAVREQQPRGRNAMTVNRRPVIKGALAAGVATQVLKVPAAPAQAAPLRVGFLTIKTGPLASGGLQMEQGLTVFFKERNNTL